MSKWTFSDEMNRVISISTVEAQQLGCNTIGIEHLLLALLDANLDAINEIFAYFSLNTDLIRQRIVKQVVESNQGGRIVNNSGTLPLVKQTERMLDLAELFFLIANFRYFIAMSKYFISGAPVTLTSARSI